MKYLTRILIVVLTLAVCTDGFAQRRGGGGRGGGMRGGGFRGGGFSGRVSARPSINHRPMARPSPRPSAPAISRPSRPSQLPSQPRRDLTPNRDINRDINRNRDVNVDRDWNVDHDWDHDGCCHVDHPIAAGAAIAATAAAVASYSYGSVVYTLPPACTTVVVDGIAYNECDGTWFQPQFVGTTTQYVVVEKPD
jgi:hypothetical protein